MERKGRRNRPFYRINAIEKRNPRDGTVIERLGWYDPLVPDWEKAVVLNEERVKHWLGVGAQPSETVTDILIRRGVIDGAARKSQIEARIAAKKKAADAKAAAGDKAA